ncbi:MAG: protein tyrosine phosphatase-like domain-containing protein [Sphingobacteriales bacterium]|nr:protein tyrosine phosphatase-like domain-containing protein [Sphingobacteriales bacterium]
MNASIEKYIKAYNLLQLGGWLAGLACLPFNFLIGYYIIALFQIYSLAEIVHALKKWHNSSPLYSFLQIGARLFILFFSYVLILSSVFSPLPWLNEVVYVMLTAWCLAEVIRYGYYVMLLFKKEYKWLIKLRYTAFIILYPLGAGCECYLLYLIFHLNAILWIKILIIGVAILYVFMFPKLYLHLLRQRRKKLNESKT